MLISKISGKKVAIGLVTTYLVALIACIPLLLISNMHKPYSFVLYDKEGILLGASVSDDGQWRFPPNDVPDQFKQALICFEDKRFYTHFGVDPLAVIRALVSNIQEGRIVSGASTITMQTVRLLQNNPPRTIGEKIKEAFLAVLFEIRYTKEEILALYAANAPYGGNVVGLEAASWRYFNRPPDSLSWAETAMLAVLPNRPSDVHPGSNRNLLLERRDTLLRTLCKKGIISQETLTLSLLEEIPPKPFDLPQYAPHYLEQMKHTLEENASVNDYSYYSTIDFDLQKNTAETLERWSERFFRNGINNGAVIIIDTKTDEILAYCANTGLDSKRNTSTKDVDMIQALRSSGSLLKPFLFAAMIDSGLLLQDQLVFDIPTRIGSYQPQNNNKDYCGAIQASNALTQSLNIPAVRELRDYGIPAFLDYLKECGFTTFNRSADEYGLPLILGGGELTLEEVTKAYSAMMRVACADETVMLTQDTDLPYSNAAAWITLDSLIKGTRPDGETLWKQYTSARKIAWKTGTSHGNRDAWAVGTTPDYTIGVWFGNAEGHGVPELKSISTTAPALFDFFSLLPETSWPSEPYFDIDYVTTCSKSGHLAGKNCAETQESIKPINAPLGDVCPYCVVATLTPDGKYRTSIDSMGDEWSGYLPLQEKYFILPPHVEYWYVNDNPQYKQLPDWVPNSTDAQSSTDLSIVFPEPYAQVYIPINLDGTLGSMVLESVHRNSDASIYWDIDGEYIGETKNKHKISVRPSQGMHTLTITDSFGNRKIRQFEVLSDFYY